jgi:hypothetical protein
MIIECLKVESTNTSIDCSTFKKGESTYFELLVLKTLSHLWNDQRSYDQSSRYISGDSMSSLLWFWHGDNILLPNLARW